MPLKRFNNTSWAAVVTPTDRPNSVCNRCVIVGLNGVFVLSCCFIGLSVGVGVFVIGLSLIFPFFSCRWYSDKVLKQLFVYLRSRKKLQTESGNITSIFTLEKFKYTVHKMFSTTRACSVILLFKIIYQNKFIIWLWESAMYDVNYPFLSRGG